MVLDDDDDHEGRLTRLTAAWPLMGPWSWFGSQPTPGCVAGTDLRSRAVVGGRAARDAPSRVSPSLTAV